MGHQVQVVMLALTETTLRFLELESQQSHQLAVEVEVITPPAAHKMVVLEVVELLTQTMGRVLEHLVKATTVVMAMPLLLMQEVEVARAQLESLARLVKVVTEVTEPHLALLALLFTMLAAVAGLETALLQVLVALEDRAVEVMVAMDWKERMKRRGTERQTLAAAEAVNETQGMERTDLAATEVLVL